jgi:hypothetical protein
MMFSPVLFAPKYLRDTSRLSTAAILGFLWLSFALPALSQVNVLTQHNDNTRSGVNTNETFLTPANVNTTTFGVLFSQAVDGLIAAQPLYVANVNIPGQGVHNVVFVVTLHDSVYAFDADSNTGANAAPLWTVNFLNPAAGITTEPVAGELGCGSTTAFTEMGILSTPVIDPASGTIYVLAKTKENGNYHFRLHALDITTGMEKLGGPLDVNATVNGKIGALMLTSAAKFMMARPGLLLSQGIVYLAFGSDGCDGGGTRGWVVAYDATSLLQLGVLNDAADTKGAHGNIWQSGSGLATDDNGNIFFATANGPFDANLGTHDFGDSVLKIGWASGGLVEEDYFTPYNQANLAAHDLDLGSAGVTMLPDQPGAHPHLIVASGKEGSVYLIDRDNMGQYNPVDNSQIVQFLPFEVGSMFSTAAYWNGNVYFTGQNMGMSQYALNNGQLNLVGRNTNTLCCPHTPSISANGNTNGILWVANQSGFLAFDAANMSTPTLYSNSKLGTLAHFNAATIANGKVYVGANLNLQILGLLSNLRTSSGDGQSIAALGTLPIQLQVTATNPYTAAPIPGVTVTFTDGGKGGTFNPASAVTDSQGRASTSYTVPKKTGVYSITATFPNSTKATFTVTVLPGAATKIQVISGNKQTAPVQTTFPLPLVVQLSDVNSNGIPGGTINFSDGGKGGVFSANPVVTDSTGKAQTFYTTPTKAGSLTFTITSGSLKTAMYGTATAGTASGISVVSGNNQAAPASTVLPAALVVLVVDQFNNVVPGATVTFTDNGAGGSFSASTAVTDTTGKATVTYTLPATPKTVNITPFLSGGAAASFTETAQ